MYSAAARLKNMTMNDTIHTPPNSAVWIAAGLRHCECASSSHGNPVNRCALSHSRHTHAPAMPPYRSSLFAGSSRRAGRSLGSSANHGHTNNPDIMSGKSSAAAQPAGGYTCLSHARVAAHAAYENANVDISHSARARGSALKGARPPSPPSGISRKSGPERLLRRTACSGGFGAGISENSERAARIAGTANTYAHSAIPHGSNDAA